MPQPHKSGVVSNLGQFLTTYTYGFDMDMVQLTVCKFHLTRAGNQPAITKIKTKFTVYPTKKKARKMCVWEKLHFCSRTRCHNNVPRAAQQSVQQTTPSARILNIHESTPWRQWPPIFILMSWWENQSATESRRGHVNYTTCYP